MGRHTHGIVNHSFAAMPRQVQLPGDLGYCSKSMDINTHYIATHRVTTMPRQLQLPWVLGIAASLWVEILMVLLPIELLQCQGKYSYLGFLGIEALDSLRHLWSVMSCRKGLYCKRQGFLTEGDID
jgi:hypothetical protein